MLVSISLPTKNKKLWVWSKNKMFILLEWFANSNMNSSFNIFKNCFYRLRKQILLIKPLFEQCYAVTGDLWPAKIVINMELFCTTLNFTCMQETIDKVLFK